MGRRRLKWRWRRWRRRCGGGCGGGCGQSHKVGRCTPVPPAPMVVLGGKAQQHPSPLRLHSTHCGAIEEGVRGSGEGGLRGDAITEVLKTPYASQLPVTFSMMLKDSRMASAKTWNWTSAALDIRGAIMPEQRLAIADRRPYGHRSSSPPLEPSTACATDHFTWD